MGNMRVEVNLTLVFIIIVWSFHILINFAVVVRAISNLLLISEELQPILVIMEPRYTNLSTISKFVTWHMLGRLLFVRSYCHYFCFSGVDIKSPFLAYPIISISVASSIVV